MGDILGLYRDNGKENGNYNLGFRDERGFPSLRGSFEVILFMEITK